MTKEAVRRTFEVYFPSNFLQGTVRILRIIIPYLEWKASIVKTV